MAIRFAIIGSGPAGFFSVKTILKSIPEAQVDIFESLPVPYGLVRYGVAPDHAEIKNVINDFSELASTPPVRFFGNIEVGKSVTHSFLKSHYSALIYAYGASADNPLEIPGGDRSISARSIVEWYNGKPGSRGIDLRNHEKMCVIGNGNVAVDVIRVLGSCTSRLRETDIADYALKEIESSNVRDIYVVARRGAIQSAMTAKELRHLIKVPGISFAVDSQDIQQSMDEISTLEADLALPNASRAQTRVRRRVFDLLKTLPAEHNSSDKVRITFKFLRSPVEFNGKSLTMRKNQLTGKAFNLVSEPTDEYDSLECDLLVRSIGYKCQEIDSSIPFDHENGIVKNAAGRVEKNVYVTGWSKTGPFGVIDTTMRSVFHTFESVFDDYKDGKFEKKEDPMRLLREMPYVDINGWRKIDAFEKELGSRTGKVREKVKSIEEMIRIAQS